MNPSKNYIALTEGRMSRTEFLRQARQSFPNLIGSGNTFEDALKILTRRGLINEELVYQNKADKFPLESIERGIRYELEIMDVYDIHHPSQEQYKKARQRAIDNLCKDPLYYVNKIAEPVEQPKQEDTEGDLKKVEAGSKHTLKENVLEKRADSTNLQEGRYMEEASGVRTNWDEKKLKIAYIIFKFGNAGINAIIDKFGPMMDKGLGYGVGQVASDGKNGEAFEDIAAALCGCTKDALKAYAVKRNDATSYLNTQTDRGGLDPRYEQIQNQYQNAKSPADILKDIEYTQDEIQKNCVNANARKKDITDRIVDRTAKKKQEMANKAKDLTSIRNQLIKQFGREKGEKMYTKYLEKHPEFNGVKPLGEATKTVSDPLFGQFYRHFVKKYKDAGDPNAELKAKKDAKAALTRYKAKQQKEKIDEMVLKESIVKLIGQVLNEAATTNLAALSDENSSVAELPGIINSLENIVTEIESFWIKEQQKIQGVFDQVGNIKNEDGLPVGYKFVQPMIDSLKKDLEPVLAKITLDDLKLPEAPAPDQTQVNDPNAQLDPNDPNAVPPVEPKQTVFSPAQKKEPLQEADVQKVLDNINDLGLSDEQKKKIIELSNAMYTAIRQNSGNMYFYARELHDYLDQVLPKTNSSLQENKKSKRYTK